MLTSTNETHGAHVPVLDSLLVKSLGRNSSSASRQKREAPPENVVLGVHVGNRMGRHIEEQEVSLLCPKHTLIDETLRQSLTNLLELVSNLHHVPCLTWICQLGHRRSTPTAHQVHPSPGTILLAALNHLQSLVKDGLSSLAIVNNLDQAVCECQPTTRRVSNHSDPSP